MLTPRNGRFQNIAWRTTASGRLWYWRNSQAESGAESFLRLLGLLFHINQSAMSITPAEDNGIYYSAPNHSNTFSTDFRLIVRPWNPLVSRRLKQILPVYLNRGDSGNNDPTFIRRRYMEGNAPQIWSWLYGSPPTWPIKWAPATAQIIDSATKSK